MNFPQHKKLKRMEKCSHQVQTENFGQRNENPEWIRFRNVSEGRYDMSNKLLGSLGGMFVLLAKPHQLAEQTVLNTFVYQLGIFMGNPQFLSNFPIHFLWDVFVEN